MRIQDLDPAWLRTFSLKKCCGRLGTFEAQLYIPEAEASGWLKRAGQEIAVTGGIEDVPIFYGIVTSTACARKKGHILAELRAVSCAVNQKEQVSYRLFQKREKTYADTLDALHQKMENCDLELDSGLKNEPLTPLVLQRESNFAFIRRLAAASGRRMWVIDTRENAPAITLCDCLDKATLKFRTDEIISLHRYASIGSKRLEFTSEKYCMLGRLVQVEDVDGLYLVTGFVYGREHGRDVFRYQLVLYEADNAPSTNPEAGRFAILRGKIANVQDPDKLGRVRFIADEPYETADGDDSSWLPWQTPYACKNGGMIFIGEKDEPAELVLWEGSGSVRCGARTSTLTDEVEDVEKTKFLGDKFGHRLIWKEDCLEIRTGENVIQLKEDEISLQAGETKIVAHKDKIDIIHKNSAVTLDKTIQLTTKGKVDITGSEINLG